MTLKHIVTMGVAGCGKTTIGANLARRLELPFFDGDDYHPRANLEKMSAGIALTDGDRLPWLLALCQVMKENPQGSVISCSALKRSYRELLSQEPVSFVFLDVPESVILERVRSREHFFPESLVLDQFLNLEAPNETEAILVDGCLEVDLICRQLVEVLVS